MTDLMKGSTINDIIAQSDDKVRSFGFRLPPFAYWTADKFAANAEKLLISKQAQLSAMHTHVIKAEDYRTLWA